VHTDGFPAFACHRITNLEIGWNAVTFSPLPKLPTSGAAKAELRTREISKTLKTLERSSTAGSCWDYETSNSNPILKHFAQRTHYNWPNFLLKWNIADMGRFWKQTANNNANYIVPIYHKKLHMKSLHQYVLEQGDWIALNFRQYISSPFMLVDWSILRALPLKIVVVCILLQVCISLFAFGMLDFLVQGWLATCKLLTTYTCTIWPIYISNLQRQTKF